MRRYIYVTILALISTASLLYGGVDKVDSHYRKGLSLYEAQRFSAAKYEFAKAREAVTSDPACEGYKMRLDYYTAMCAGELVNQTAPELLERFLADYPNSIYNNDVRFAKASISYSKEAYTAANADYLAVNPFELSRTKQSEYYFKLAHSLFMNDSYDKAYTNLRQVDPQSPYAPHAQYYTAYIDYTRANYNAAKEGFLKLVNNDTYSKLVPFYLLQIEFLQNNFQYVVDNGDALLTVAVKSRAQEIARLIGESWYRLGNYSKALDYMGMYVELGGEMNREELYIVGYSYYMQGGYQQAIEPLSQVCAVDDQLSQNASYHLADSYLKTDDKRSAMRSFSIAAVGGYDDAIREDALFNYGKLQYELGGGVFNEAINVLNKYLADYPTSKRVPQVREYLISAYYNSRNYEAAYEAIKLFPNPDNNIKTALQKIAYFRALEYFNTGDYDSSYKLLEQATAYSFNPKYTALTAYWKAEILFRQGDYSAAIPLFKEYLRLSPSTEKENVFVIYNLGYCYFALRRWSDAQDWFGKFLARYKSSDAYRADAYNRLGDVIYSKREFWKSIENYDNAIKINTEQKYYAQYQRAVMLGLVDRDQRKIESLNQIISDNKGDYIDDAMYELGRTYIGSERFADGASMLKRFVASYPSSERYIAALSDLGLVYQNLGDTHEALKYYKMVVDKAPHSSAAKDAMQGIRGIYVDTNDVDSYFAYAKSSGVETDLSVVQRDSLSFASAERIYLTGDAERSIPVMKTYLKSYPKGAYRTNALYYLGDCSLRYGDKKGAESALSELSDMYYNDFTVRGLEKLSKLYSDDKDYSAAAQAYKKLSATATSSVIAVDALKGYLRSTVIQDQPAQTIAVADDVLSAVFADKDVVREAKFAKAKALEVTDAQAQALDLYRELATESVTSEGAQSSYKVIENLYKSEDLKGAEKLIFALSDQNSPHTYEVGKAFLILGDIYAKQGDAFQARATYQSIVDGYSPANDGVVETAKDRIKSLK